MTKVFMENDRQVIENCLSHFRLLHSFAVANGPIVKHGHGKIGKAKVIAEECIHAIENLEGYLSNSSEPNGAASTPAKQANPSNP